MQLLFTASVTPVIHNWWDIKDQNAQLVELIMFFKVRCTTPASPGLTQLEYNKFKAGHQELAGNFRRNPTAGTAHQHL